MNIQNNIQKLLNWEYWPAYMFYLPNIPFALYHSIKAKSLVFYTATNPGIENSGIGTESKYKTLQLLPKKYIPPTVFHKANSSIENTLKKINSQQISYPLIVKPDIGFRGLLVKKIENKDDLICHLNKHPIDILIQKFLTKKNECGIFYYRFPGEKKGKISSITLKEFLHVVGDGKSTLKALILNNKRAKMYFNSIKENPNLDFQKIIKKGQKINLSSIGNHSKGTRFINGNHLISNKLENYLNTLNQRVDGWYYGRLDIKYNLFSDLEKGDFKILELNGILAEPTHVYDTEKTTYFKALKNLRLHWKQLYKIALLNHKKYGIPYKNTRKFIHEIIALKKYISAIKSY